MMGYTLTRETALLTRYPRTRDNSALGLAPMLEVQDRRPAKGPYSGQTRVQSVAGISPTLDQFSCKYYRIMAIHGISIFMRVSLFGLSLDVLILHGHTSNSFPEDLMLQGQPPNYKDPKYNFKGLSVFDLSEGNSGCICLAIVT